MKVALDQCRIATEQRNVLIHGLKISTGPEGSVITLRSRRGTFEPTVENWTDESIRSVASQLSAARFTLHDTIREALGYEALSVEYTLGEETRSLHHPSDEVSS